MSNTEETIATELGISVDKIRKLLALEESLKAAGKKYRDTHQQEIKEHNKSYYHKMKNDDEYKKKRSEKNKRYYQRHKEELKEKREQKQREAEQQLSQSVE